MIGSSKMLLATLLSGTILAAPAVAQTAAPATPNSTAEPRAPSTSDPASAQPGVQDIIVTAQRTGQSLQKVPIAVNVVSGADLTTRGLTDTGALSAVVPNLSLNRNGVVANPYLRGIGSNGSNPNDEQSVATYIDGVYIASPLGNVFSLNNIERVEVLKGPQGTLFGRNATGGVIQIITRDPSKTPGVEASIGYGNYDTLEGAIYATTGLGSNLAIDLATTYSKNFDGYGRDTFRNADILKREDFALRSKLLWTPGASTEVRLSGDYSDVHTSGTDYQLAQGVIGADGMSTYPGERRTTTNFPNRARNQARGVSLRVDQDLDFARLVSISAYRRTTGTYLLDQDATPVSIVDATLSQKARTISQEVQLLSANGSKVDWLIGGFYFNGNYAYDPARLAGLGIVGLFSVPAVDIFGEQRTRSLSAYGQATVEILADTKLTGGLRYTHERQSIDGSVAIGGATVVAPPTQRQGFDKLTWRVALDHQFTPSVLGYVSYNRGIKSGGYNLLGPGSPGYRPENLDAYEVGLKSDLFNRLVRLNIAAFYYNYKDIQVQSLQAGAINTSNAAKAHVKGIDADITIVPTRDLTLSGGIGYTDGEYTRFPNAVFTPPSPLDGPATLGDASGNDLQNAPRFTANAAANYTIPSSVGPFLLSANVSYRSKTFVTPDNRLAIPGYALANASLGWTAENGVIGARLWVRNLFDEDYYVSRIEQALGDIQYQGAPRTYGVTLSTKF